MALLGRSVLAPRRFPAGARPISHRTASRHRGRSRECAASPATSRWGDTRFPKDSGFPYTCVRFPMDPRFVEDPEEFWPERFLRDPLDFVLVREVSVSHFLSQLQLSLLASTLGTSASPAVSQNEIKETPKTRRRGRSTCQRLETGRSRQEELARNLLQWKRILYGTDTIRLPLAAPKGGHGGTWTTPRRPRCRGRLDVRKIPGQTAPLAPLATGSQQRLDDEGYAV